MNIEFNPDTDIEITLGRLWEHTILLFIELAKLDKSGVGYAQVREQLPVYLKKTKDIPSPVRDFIADEMMRERPFYPDKGRLVTDEVMRRSVDVGLRIISMKSEQPDRSIVQDIIPELAKQTNKSVGTIKQDYEQRFLPIYNQASINASINSGVTRTIENIFPSVTRINPR